MVALTLIWFAFSSLSNSQSLILFSLFLLHDIFWDLFPWTNLQNENKYNIVFFFLFFPRCQESLIWITKVHEMLGGEEVSDEKMKEFIWNHLKSGQVGLVLKLINASAHIVDLGSL